MKKNIFPRKAMALCLTVVFLLVFLGVAFAEVEEEETRGRGFVLFGISKLYEGSEKLRGGVIQLLDGNKRLVEGLDALSEGLDENIAGNLSQVKSGIDGKMLPGLDAILHGMVDKIVPGLSDMKKGLDGEVVPGLIELRAGLRDKMSPGLKDILNGLTDQILPGLSKMLAGIDQEMIDGLDSMIEGLAKPDGMIDGLTQIRYGLSMSADPAHPGFDPTNPDTFGVSEGLAGVLAGLGAVGQDETVVDGLTQIRYGLSGVGDPANPGVSEGLAQILAGLGSREDVDTVINGIYRINTETANSIPQLQAALAIVEDPDQPDAVKILIATVALQTVLSSLDNEDPAPGENPGLLQATAMLLEGLEEMAAGLDQMKTNIDGRMIPGLDNVLEGVNDKIIPGLSNMKTGVDGRMVPGLDNILTGINTEMIPGLNNMKAGIDNLMVPGLDQILAGIGDADTKDTLLYGLIAVRYGLSGVGDPNNPGVNEGLDTILDGIDNKIIPGLKVPSIIFRKFIYPPGRHQLTSSYF